MRTTFYGHACLKAEGPEGAVLLDPWFSPEGAFFGAWHQFPDNAAFLERALEGVSDVLVSHNHNDHFDPPVLERALRDPRVRLHVPRYAAGWLLSRVRALAPSLLPRLSEHGAYERFRAGGLEAFFVPEEWPGSVDAAIVLRDASGQSLLDLNDARLSAEPLRRIRSELGRVGLVALQASGASEYPVCYAYPAAEKRARARRKRGEKFELCRQTLELLDPERVLFFAGPPVFLDPALAALDERGEDSVFPDQSEVLAHFRAAVPAMHARAYFAVPGDELDDRVLAERARPGDPRLAPYADKPAYLRAYAARRPAAAFDWGRAPAEPALRAYFESMPRLSPALSAAIGGPVTFAARDAGGAETAWTVDFASATARPGRDDAALYVLSFPASCLGPLLEGRATWDDLFLSMRVVFEERTDRFIVELKTLLRYMDAALFRAIEEHERRQAGAADCFELESGGRRLRVQRRCPHAGADLEAHGRVSEGVLTCLSHRFRFDLSDGRCLNARGHRLRVEEVTRTGPAR